MSRHHSIAFLASLMLAACASTPGAQPHDMSVAGHEAMAQGEDAAAAAHAAQFDSSATHQHPRCPTSTGGGADACWSSTTNPTAEHLKRADDARKRAAEHRAASQALRDAEARACIGISEDDRAMSPFAHREDIAAVEARNTHPEGRGKPTPSVRLSGATVSFRATPGMTAQWLQRVVDCHLARNAAMGHDAPDMAYCPLALKDVTASVTATSNGFDVAIVSDDYGTAERILARAQALVGR